ncbi:hypothetical protein WNY78_12985 [Psychroserpens sp. AS72]|uniref:hypothetical protein n=1 Tax=Psychroserpens sp. AS72 TaxID=3135775 RepID=UPI003173D24D
MKKILKTISILLLVITFSCGDDDNGRFSSDPSSGWIEFFTSSTTTGQTVSSVTIPVSVRVPEYLNGLNITYTIEAVEGDYTQFVSSNGGTLFADPALVGGEDIYARALNVDLELMNMEVGRDFVTSFDVILTAVDASNVTIGVPGSSHITSHRVTIPCSNPDVLPADYFVGDYAISDVAASIGPGNGTENFGAGTVTLTVDPFNPNVRLFEATILPAFTGGAPFPTSIEFSVDDYVTLGGYVGAGISCNGVDEYGFTSAAAADSVPWDVCNDLSITINYVEDPNIACGGPYASSFSLTKL